MFRALLAMAAAVLVSAAMGSLLLLDGSYDVAGFFALPLIGGLLGKAAKAAKGFVEKKILGKKPASSAPAVPSQWRPGLPAPPGYRVVSAGTRSEHLEVAIRPDAGVADSIAGAEQRARESESLIEFARRRITEELGRATSDVTKATGEQIAAGIAKSETARREKGKITAAFVAGGVLLLITLGTVVWAATRRGR